MKLITELKLKVAVAIGVAEGFRKSAKRYGTTDYQKGWYDGRIKAFEEVEAMLKGVADKQPTEASK